MKIKINTLQIWGDAENTQIGAVYATAMGGEPLLRIGICIAHEQEYDCVAFLRLDEKDLSTVVYPPTQRMICIGEPTLTIQ
jgi:hypothetical protein